MAKEDRKNLSREKLENLAFQKMIKTQQKPEDLDFEDVPKNQKKMSPAPENAEPKPSSTEDTETKLKEALARIEALKEDLRKTNLDLSDLDKNKLESNNALRVESDGVSEKRTYPPDFIKKLLLELLKNEKEIKSIYYSDIKGGNTPEEIILKLGINGGGTEGNTELTFGNKGSTIELKNCEFTGSFLKKIWMSTSLKPKLEKLFDNLKEEFSFEETYEIDSLKIKNGQIELISQKSNFPTEHQAWLDKKEAIESKKAVLESTLSELEKNADALTAKLEGRDQPQKIEKNDIEYLATEIEFNIRDMSPKELNRIKQEGDSLFGSKSKGWQLAKEFLNDLEVQEKTIKIGGKVEVIEEVAGKDKMVGAIAVLGRWANNSEKQNLQRVALESFEVFKKLMKIKERGNTILKSPEKTESTTYAKVAREEEAQEEEPLNERHKLSLSEIEEVEDEYSKQVSYVGYYIPPSVDILEKDITDFKEKLNIFKKLKGKDIEDYKKRSAIFKKLKKLKAESVEEVAKMLRDEYSKEEDGQEEEPLVDEQPIMPIAPETTPDTVIQEIINTYQELTTDSDSKEEPEKVIENTTEKQEAKEPELEEINITEKVQQELKEEIEKYFKDLFIYIDTCLLTKTE